MDKVTSLTFLQILTVSQVLCLLFCLSQYHDIRTYEPINESDREKIKAIRSSQTLIGDKREAINAKQTTYTIA